MKISDKLLKALEKTYAEVPVKMFESELIIFVSSDWDEKLANCMGFLYRGIEVKIIPKAYPYEQKIIIMKKSDYENLKNVYGNKLR